LQPPPQPPPQLPPQPPPQPPPQLPPQLPPQPPPQRRQTARSGRIDPSASPSCLVPRRRGGKPATPSPLSPLSNWWHWQNYCSSRSRTTKHQPLLITTGQCRKPATPSVAVATAGLVMMVLAVMGVAALL
ncbi:hypothetical protein Vretimale_10997, partial [Volvox reticuliferus]